MLNTVQVKFTGRTETVIEEKTVEFLPEYIKKVYGKSIGLTALLTPAMTFICLWRLPAFLVQRVSKLREMSAIAEKYTDPKGNKQQIKEVCEKYARYVFEHIVKKMEIQALATEAMQGFYGRIDELDKDMKETISSDRKFT
ncbi:hypothetical protein DPMN_040783 [Dreissena polymorpha]|uniref:Uncharacterized protein n=1 Tax=Dreissena polymorpha TaxID=45954 RepID=A0A9D4CYA3_DREPO|nr:hypothetical protein DPMN_040783 [Dreissena polymorpha]